MCLATHAVVLEATWKVNVVGVEPKPIIQILTALIFVIRVIENIKFSKEGRKKRIRFVR